MAHLEVPAAAQVMQPQQVLAVLELQDRVMPEEEVLALHQDTTAAVAVEQEQLEQQGQAVLLG
jgi:hypothetical protein